jgi:hypothetical protein
MGRRTQGQEGTLAETDLNPLSSLLDLKTEVLSWEVGPACGKAGVCRWPSLSSVDAYVGGSQTDTFSPSSRINSLTSNIPRTGPWLRLSDVQRSAGCVSPYPHQPASESQSILPSPDLGAGGSISGSNEPRLPHPHPHPHPHHQALCSELQVLFSLNRFILQSNLQRRHTGPSLAIPSCWEMRQGQGAV